MTAIAQASLDRGFGRCSVLRSQKAIMKKHPNRTWDRIMCPQVSCTGCQGLSRFEPLLGIACSALAWSDGTI